MSNVSHSLNDVSSEEIFARFLLKTINVTIDSCLEIYQKDGNCDNYIFQQYSTFLMYCIHICHSGKAIVTILDNNFTAFSFLGSHCKVANTLINLLEPLEIDKVNEKFLKLGPALPLLVLQHCYLLTLLNYNSQKFWSQILQIQKTDGIVHCSPPYKSGAKSSLNQEIIKIGGGILFCDYVSVNISDAEQLTWLLVNNIEYIVKLSSEQPIWDLINVVHRNPAASGLFLQAIATRCQNKEPSFINKILKSIEICHPNQSGALLLLLIPNFLTSKHLSLSRYASRLATKATEILLTITSYEEIIDILPKDDLILIINNLIDNKLIKK